MPSVPSASYILSLFQLIFSSSCFTGTRSGECSALQVFSGHVYQSQKKDQLCDAVGGTVQDLLVFRGHVCVCFYFGSCIC